MRVVLLLLVCVLACTSARTINWSGGAGNSLWNFANNWDSNSVPTGDDDVIISPVGGGTVTISQAATARTVRVGGGGYPTTLALQASLKVVDLTIAQSGALRIASNNDMPLTATGTARALLGSSIDFQSGALVGLFIVEPGASILFSSSALKLLNNANLTISNGAAATVQPTTIQLTKGALLNILGNFRAIGQVTIFANDKPNWIYCKGNFTYAGQSASAPLTIQVNSTFDSDINIESGAVLIEASATVTGTVKLPQGAALTIQSGADYTWFRSIQGAGSVIVDSATEMVNLNVSWVTLADSGSLTISANSSTKSLSVSGKLILGPRVTFAATDVSVIAGTVTGTGRLTASGNFEIAPTSIGNANSFISTEVVVAGRGYTTNVVQILFSDLGNLHILAGATFTISAAVTLLKQSGTPVITNEGTFTVNLPVGAVVPIYVDYIGTSGNLVFSGGQVIFQGDKVYADKFSVTTTLVEFRTAEAHFGAVSGTGSINVTAAPSATSTFGDSNLAYFGVVNGNVSVGVLTVNTLEVFNGILNIATSNSHTATSHTATSHTATIFNFFGGTLNGNGVLASSTLNFTPSAPATLRSIKINTKQFKLLPTVASTAILVENFASITTTA